MNTIRDLVKESNALIDQLKVVVSTPVTPTYRTEAIRLAWNHIFPTGKTVVYYLNHMEDLNTYQITNGKVTVALCCMLGQYDLG